MSECLICETAYEPFLSFGEMPIANGFLTAEQFADEYTFELKALGKAKAGKQKKGGRWKQWKNDPDDSNHQTGSPREDPCQP